MSLTAAEAGILVVAGFLSGASNAVAGGGSLITFPALVAVGYPPLAANITTTVAMTPGHLGGSIGYRRELREQTDRIRRLVPATALGGLTGAVLLVTTPASTFEIVVPFLVLLACGLLAAQPSIQTWVQERPHLHLLHHPAALHAGMFAASVYGAYFGGGLGVLFLAILGIFIVEELQPLNALKTFLMLVVTVVAITLYAVVGPVEWTAAALVAPASLVGGFVGASVARLLPANVLRWSIVGLGVVVAIVLFARAVT